MSEANDSPVGGVPLQDEGPASTWWSGTATWSRKPTSEVLVAGTRVDTPPARTTGT